MDLALDLMLAAVLLGLPMLLFSWALFLRLFQSGDLGRDLDRKMLNAELKKYGKKASKNKQSKSRFFYDKWMWFGGGFYGLAGLWTFAVIETQQLIAFVLDFPGLGSLIDNGLISLIVNFLLNQLGNLLQGLLWFSWWPAESIPIWIGIAYLGYWVGIELARRQIAIRVLWQRGPKQEAAGD